MHRPKEHPHPPEDAFQPDDPRSCSLHHNPGMGLAFLWRAKHRPLHRRHVFAAVHPGGRRSCREESGDAALWTFEDEEQSRRSGSKAAVSACGELCSGDVALCAGDIAGGGYSWDRRPTRPMGVGHGQTSCVLLPAVLKYNKRVNGEKQEQVKLIIWGEKEVVEELGRAGLKQENSDVSDALRIVFNELGMPASLKEVGVGRDKFGVIARNSLKDPCCIVNPVPLTDEAQILEMLEMVVD